MSKKANVKDILSWFDLSRYDYLLKLPVKHVLAEVYFRQGIHETFLDKAMNGDFPVFDHIETMEEDHQMDGVHFNDRGILPVSYGFLGEVINTAIKKGIYKVSPNELAIDDDLYYRTACLAEVYTYENDEEGKKTETVSEKFNIGMLIDLSLDLMTDEEITNHIAYNLPKWRKRFSIPQPKVVGEGQKIGFSFIEKLHHYRIVPFLDLQMWANKNRVIITNDVYSRLLFPIEGGEIRSDAHIRNTVKPFSDSTFDVIYQPELSLFLAKNPHIEDMLFSDFLDLAKNR